MRHWLKQLYQICFPNTCILCASHSTLNIDLCKPCLKDFPHSQFTCKQCANTLCVAADKCADCLTKIPPFRQTFSLFDYALPVNYLLSQLKFNERFAVTPIFSELLYQKIKYDWYADNPLPQVIIPVPLHLARLKQRGFNQAFELIKPLEKRLGLPIDTQSVRRVKNTLPQAKVDLKTRYANLQGAFELTRPCRYTHIALFDDVVTTGNTVMALAKLFSAAGVKTIDILCCAKTQR